SPGATAAEDDLPAAGYYFDDRAASRGPRSQVVSRAESKRESKSRANNRARRPKDLSAEDRPSVRTDSPAWLYPLQGAESLTVVVVLGVAFWVFTVLVPEYCRSLMSDAEMLGATSMGHLIAIVSSLPAVLLLMPVLFYALQYLARVLVASALGDAR